MSYPELYSDERVVLQAQNVKVKSVSFEVVLTTRRLVLVDVKKNSIPPQEINLATLKDVESGENAIRDPTITISIITISGNTRQMVLTFSKISGGERRRECEDWVRALRQNITTTVYHPVSSASAPKEIQPAPAVQPPAPAPPRIEITNNPPPKKRIEIARPMKKIVEAAPAMPVPVETISLPTGSFCNRCGNRVPPESAFCNRCGTPVIRDAGSEYLPQEDADVIPQQSVPVVPQVRITPPPVSGAATDKKDSPIEEVIHSIEPLIEDSVPRTAPAPLVPAKHVPPQVPGEPEEIPLATTAETPAEGATPGIQWPVLSRSESAGASPSPDTTLQTPAAPLPPRSPPPAPSRKPHYLVIAILVLSLLALFAGAYVFISSQPGTVDMTPTITPTPVIPTTATAVPTPVSQQTPVMVTPAQTPAQTFTVPTTGVWVKVTYPNTFSGMVGTPGRLNDISGTGTGLYQIPTIDGPVSVSIQKGDGSVSEMAVDVYKNGEVMKHSQTIVPKGVIEMQVILKPTITANTTTTTRIS